MTSHVVPTPSTQRHRIPGTPRDALGWWGCGLLGAAALNPLYCWGLWALIHFDDPEARWRVAATLVVGVPAVVLGAAALTRRSSRSIALIAAAAIVGLEIAWAVFFVVAFEAPGLGAAIAGGTAFCLLVGGAIGTRRRPDRSPDEPTSR